MAAETLNNEKLTAGHGRVRIAEGVTSHMLGDQLLVFSEPTQTLYSLNPSAAYMWLCLESGRSVAETSRAVSETFNIRVVQAVSDVEAIVGEWTDAGLLIPADASAVAGHAARVEDEEFPALEPYEGTLPESFFSQFHFLLGRSTFLVRCEREEHERLVRPILAHLETDVEKHDVVLTVVSDGTEHVIVRDGLIAGSVPYPDQIGPVLGQEALRCAYSRIDCLIAIHAAVVHNGSESVILAGPSGVGKSTLTAALIKGGLGYFTDEVAILHRDTRRVLPLPAGLRVKEGSWEVMSRLYPHFVELPVYRLVDRGSLRYFPPPPQCCPSGYESGLPVRALIFPYYAPGDATNMWQVDKVEALHRVQEGGYEAGDRLDQARIRELIDWISSIDCFKMPVSSLDQAVAIIRGVFG